MAGSITKLLLASVAFAYGVFTVFLYFGIALADGTFFKRRTEKEKLELELGKYFKSLPPRPLHTDSDIPITENVILILWGSIARDRLWNLSKPYNDLTHHVLTLPSGFKFHFVSNEAPGSEAALISDKPLVIFIHGFPDSWAIWRHIISSPSLQNAAHLVAIDLPGYGGSQGLDKYSGTNVLERLTELIITLRTEYGVDDSSETNKKKAIIVAHDWGCVLAMRLASEAPSLAHRFILTNGPIVCSVNIWIVMKTDPRCSRVSSNLTSVA